LRLAVLILPLAACMSTSRWDKQESWAGKDIGSFPYHPLVYHLDLSILTYQLYTQTLVWPFDPYYEEIQRRDEYMAKVRAWAHRQAAAQAGRSGLDAYRGPGVLGGFPDNPGHDPILFRYGGLHPWSDAISNPADEWLELKTPKAITGRIQDVYVCYRRAGGPDSAGSWNRSGPGATTGRPAPATSCWPSRAKRATRATPDSPRRKASWGSCSCGPGPTAATTYTSRFAEAEAATIFER